MKQWIVVKFTGLGIIAKAGDVTIWAYDPDITYNNTVKIVAHCETYEEAQAIARHERMHKHPNLMHQAT